ncbi:MAG: bifunctional 23S rRNA (guanine(2069)-N(7))-methyltransferase RlmK/23S rRNA (guanine(2445)-N(2))-methyltransferase RlmL [Oleiphilaceae bacterium]|nr:bifunctional 23S rRNA (guanine(2069)-N(7))-methyltransferase RlmK/23S rRNA (guanine(2445)-N(2))-methyltransferase RlmL [Oleiphilaceae bacterium]
MSLDLIVTCPKGVEYLQSDELEQLGVTVLQTTASAVIARTDLAGAYRVCLWSRLANRVLLLLRDQPAKTAEDLVDVSTAVPWEQHLAPGGRFRVTFQGESREIRNTQFGAQSVKDGVLDRMRGAGQIRPVVDKADPDLSIHARLAKGRLQLSLDLAGESLHRRGYRSEAGEAPLKENLAAALLLRAGWPALAEAGADLVDPLCGSGTLPIEAALMATDTAPGLLRETFALQRWPGHDPALWQSLVDEARERARLGRERSRSRLWGFDQTRSLIPVAWGNIERADVADRVHVERRALEDYESPSANPRGLMITNPPYGERLGEQEALGGLYALLGQQALAAHQGWRLAVFTAIPELGHRLGLRSHKQYKLFNGALPAQLLLFDLEPESVRTLPRADGLPHARISHPERAAMLGNRLRKNQRILGSWARKGDIACYRVYDADMPEFSLAIDRYDDWLHVQEYAPPATVDAAVARERLAEAMAVIPEALSVDPEKVVIKQRRRQKGTSQYEKQGEEGRAITVMEGGALFRINLQDYLDTGLFLDHRPVRLWLQKNSAQKRVLNLFCYTGAATVHAALGGASRSLSLDMSNTYLDWARHNWRLNHMDEARHQLERVDCLKWLASPVRSRFDVIFMDPPTFSNSSKMDSELDVQRDHVTLIEQAMARLTPDGVLIFSTNYRRFQLDESLAGAYQLEDRSAWSRDRDFARNPRIHQCWFVRHKAE